MLDSKWTEFHYQLLYEPDKGYVTMASYDNWDTKLRETALVNELRLTPGRVSISPKLSWGGVTIPFAFELISPKKRSQMRLTLPENRTNGRLLAKPSSKG